MLHVRAGWFGRCPCCHHTCLHCKGWGWGHVEDVLHSLIKLLIPSCMPSSVYHKVTKPVMTAWLLGRLVKTRTSQKDYLIVFTAIYSVDGTVEVQGNT